MGRRKRISEQTAQEIKDIARGLLEEKGTAGLSLRAIAREMGMSAPAIYTYFPSMDDLITALIVDAFNDYADTLEAASSACETQGLVPQLMAVTLAYREWAVTNRTQFQLIYGSPIPGYDAPREVTLPAVLRTGNVFIELVKQLEAAGEMPAPDTSAVIPPTVAHHLQEAAGPDAPEVEVHRLYMIYGIWVILHGMVTLEVFNHLQGTVGDTAAFYEAQVRHHYRALGLDV